jgi:hypothetical protein
MKNKKLTILAAVGALLALCLVGSYILRNRPQTMTFVCVDAVAADARVDLVGPRGDVLADNLAVIAFKGAKEPLGPDAAGEVTVRLAPKEAKRIAKASKAGPVRALSHSLSTLLLGSPAN